MSASRIAALPMYDFAELRADTDALWARLAMSLRAAGIDGVPEALSRDRGHLEIWQDANLLLPYGIALDPSGNVWVSNYFNNDVVVFFGLATPTAVPLSPTPAAP